LQPILPEALRVCRAWLDGLPVDDFNRHSVLHLEALTENLIRNGKPPMKAMLRMQSLLCGNCRNLHAVDDRCLGKSLDQCALLNDTF
jgi:hypothetical protein